MSSILAVVAAGAITIYGLLHLLLYYTHDVKEPPLVPTSFPFFGHTIGLWKKKSKYYIELRDKYNLPIYTLRLLGARLYVINSTLLIPSVQKQFRILAFPPLAAKYTERICGSSKAARDILNTNVNGDEGTWGHSMTFYKNIRTSLSPGPGFDAMNRVMIQAVAASIDGLKQERVVKLFDFIRHEITLATTDSVYGPRNPFKDPAIEQSFWKFQPGIMILITNVFPSLFAKESLKARESLTEAFIQYFKENGHTEGSALIKTRFEQNTEYKVPLEDIARLEVGGAIGILSNTAPSSFWMTYHLYSDDNVLEEIRQELANVVTDVATTTPDGHIVNIRTLDMSRVKVSCPILLSTFQEVLRIHTVGISTKLVMEDHLLDRKHLLKKGGTVMIPGPVQHTNASSWGPNVDSFDHRRFLTKSKTHNPVAFRSFGGGTTLCPGRHFASTEILAFTALLVLRCDVKPTNGKWIRPGINIAGIWEVTPMAVEDIEVKITPRADEDTATKWRVLLTDSDKGIPLSAEDL